MGDSLVALPSLRVLKRFYPESYFYYVSDYHPNKNFVSPKSIFDGLNIIDEFLTWSYSNSLFGRAISLFKLLIYLRKQRIDTAVLLERNTRGSHYIHAHKLFFRLSGIKESITDDLHSADLRDNHGKLVYLDHESDNLLNILRKNNIELNFPINVYEELQINPSSISLSNVNNWFLSKNLDDINCIAIAVGSNMPLKKWPIKNYIQCLNSLHDIYDFVPIFIGGTSDIKTIDEIINVTGGYNVAGLFNINESIALLQKCKFYLGNDTGSHHLATAAGIPAVVIFSSRDNPGKWDPYGNHSIVLRQHVYCEGCMLSICNKSPTCIQQIPVERVFDSCKKVLSSLV